MYYNNETTVFQNGKWLKAKDAKASMYNQTLHYGIGVFEGIRSYKNVNGCNIFRAKEHYDRLLYSAEKMHIEVPYTVEELVGITYQLLDKNNLSDAYIRPLVYQGMNMALTPASETNVFIGAWEWAKYLGNEPLNVMISSYQRPNPKSCVMEAKVVGHYTNSVLATTEARKLGYDEALLLDIHGYVAQGPGANFFYEKDGVLYTPPAGNILPGITRATIMELAKELEIRVIESHFTVDEVYDADYAFFAGTAVEITPIGAINGEKFKANWEESAGHSIYQMYRTKVQHNEYQGLTIV
ncbi:branched-chain amino acid transaminase [Fulvivirga ligni]|uniref:branched-chain amino acid transaminase n=1 Tax=Fulvivirga ligni TaxID=2904246 RepID=UPI001F16ADED|nr:branched-chain amino acid transaminase [Fulvivirga ligni]UII23357.1 branched-chain amino acid transaminase [Fulvivirga ligni]